MRAAALLFIAGASAEMQLPVMLQKAQQVFKQWEANKASNVDSEPVHVAVGEQKWTINSTTHMFQWAIDQVQEWQDAATGNNGAIPAELRRPMMVGMGEHSWNVSNLVHKMQDYVGGAVASKTQFTMQLSQNYTAPRRAHGQNLELKPLDKDHPKCFPGESFVEINFVELLKKAKQLLDVCQDLDVTVTAKQAAPAYLPEGARLAPSSPGGGRSRRAHTLSAEVAEPLHSEEQNPAPILYNVKFVNMTQAFQWLQQYVIESPYFNFTERVMTYKQYVANGGPAQIPMYEHPLKIMNGMTGWTEYVGKDPEDPAQDTIVKRRAHTAQVPKAHAKAEPRADAKQEGEKPLWQQWTTVGDWGRQDPTRLRGGKKH